MIRLQNVLKMSFRRICETSWKRLENVLKTLRQDVLKTSWRHLENVLKTSWRRMDKTNILVLTKTSWRRLEDLFWRRMINKNIFAFIKTSFEDEFERRLHQDECLLGQIFGSSLFHSLMAWGKECFFWSIQVYKEIHWKYWAACESFWYVFKKFWICDGFPVKGTL